MPTSPTALANPSSARSTDLPLPLTAVPVTAKISVLPLLIAVVVGVVIAALCAGGAVYYLARTGRLPMRDGSASKAEAGAPVTTHAIVLDPLLVNLADTGGSSYLRVSVALRVADGAGGRQAKEEKSQEGNESSDAVASVRDTMLAVLGRQTADHLLAVDGKQRLKAELRAALAEHNADLKVKDVFFSDFLVQR